MKKILTSIALLLAGLFLAADLDAALIDRGTGMVYETDLGITWLQDANYAMTSGYRPDGRFSWAEANTWANTLVYGGHSDWRLPSALNPDGSGPVGSYNVINSEMGHLYYTELMNSAGGPLSNTGPFQNVQAAMYWSATHHDSIADRAWSFSFRDGGQGETLDWQRDEYAWAVRDGDTPDLRFPHPLHMSLVRCFSAIPSPLTIGG